MSFAPGKIVGGRFTIEEKLGKTARGTTYAAITMPSREVALKVVSIYVREKDRARLLEAIRKQNATLERVPDRVLLRVIDAGIDGEETLYVVSPRSPHPSLAQLVELCPLTPEEAMKVIWRLARALDAMHEAGIAHLALKPTNIFVGPAPDYQVHLADFSSDLVRRVLDDDDDGGLWLAPEQIRDPSSARATADVYAAARIMFFALTGKELPRGRRPVEYSIEIGRVIPPELDGPLLCGLDPNPEARYTSATALAEALGPASLPSIEALEAPPPPIDVAPLAVAPTPVFEEVVETDSTPAPLLEASSPAVADADVPIPRPLFSHFRMVVAISASALGAVVLLVIVIAIVSSRKSAPQPSVAVAASTSAAASAIVAVAPPEPAKPPEEAPAPAPTPAPTPEPEPPPTPAPAETVADTSALPPLGANEAQIEVTCEPKCDFVMINGKNSTYPAPIRVGPGMHAVNPIKFGHAAPWQKVIVKAGETKSVEFAMLPVIPSAPPPAAAAKKPCGKFLKRCD